MDINKNHICSRLTKDLSKSFFVNLYKIHIYIKDTHTMSLSSFIFLSILKTDHMTYYLIKSVWHCLRAVAEVVNAACLNLKRV